MSGREEESQEKSFFCPVAPPGEREIISPEIDVNVPVENESIVSDCENDFGVPGDMIQMVRMTMDSFYSSPYRFGWLPGRP